MNKTLTKIDNIRNLFEKIENNEDFFKRISEEFKISVSTARSNWFSRFEITDKYRLQEQVIEFMQNYISNQ